MARVELGLAALVGMAAQAVSAMVVTVVTVAMVAMVALAALAVLGRESNAHLQPTVSLRSQTIFLPLARLVRHCACQENPPMHTWRQTACKPNRRAESDYTHLTRQAS